MGHEAGGQPIRRLGDGMGLGDWIMATADVKKLNEATKRRIVVVGKGSKPMWSEVFEHNPRIAKSIHHVERGELVQTLVNGPNMRPYIAGKTDQKWSWRRLRNQSPGEIWLTEGEKAFAQLYKDMLVVEPNVKANGHTNKAWSFDRWEEVARKNLHPMVQCGGVGTKWLPGVTRVETPTFRHAAAVLSVAKGIVTTEGALHHAAAAFSIPAVILWSEFISPDVTGYQSQHNLRHAGDPCGMRVPCKTCAISMDKISVDEVTEAIQKLLK